MSSDRIQKGRLRKILLICGIIYSLLYVGTDVLGGMLWKGYSFISQPISALGAIGSPVRTLTDPLFTTDIVLLIPFGLGVWGSAGPKRALRVVGGLLTGIGFVGIMWTQFPMHVDEPVSSPANTMHSIFAGVQVFLILFAMGFGAIAYRKRFRFYSIASIITLLLAGVAGFALAATENPMQLFGVIERINVYGYLLWVAVLASYVLWRSKQ